MSKRLVQCMIALFAAIIGALPICIVSSAFGNKRDAEPTAAVDFESNVRPEGEALDLTLPTNEEEAIAFVAKLYGIACENYRQAQNAAYMVKSHTLMLGTVDVPGYRYCVKNGDKYHYLEYSFVDADSTNSAVAVLSMIMGSVASDSTKFALARYTDDTMQGMTSRKVVVGKTASRVSRTVREDGSVVFDVDWATPTESTEEKPLYCASQDGEFCHTDHTVNADTIMSATVEYNAEDRYYVCTFELDPELAPLAKTLPSLKANSGNDKAHYTSLKQVMHVWDNGYLKYYRAIDKWEAGSIVTSTIDFHTTYYYDEQHTDIANYQYMSEMCHK